MNEYILKSMDALENPGKYSQKELDDNRDSAAAAAYTDSTAAAYAAYAAAAYAAAAKRWINKYFERSGDNKQEYIDALKFKPLTPEVELTDGKAYQFDIEFVGTVCGVYYKALNELNGSEDNYEPEICTNIKLLTVKGEL